MTDEENGLAALRKAAHFAEAFLLKCHVTHGEHFVDDEDFGFEMRCNRKGKSDVHARGVALDRRVEEFLDLRERNDLIEFADDFSASHAQDRAIQEDILAPGEFRMKSRAYLKKTGNATADSNFTLGRFGNPAEELEQRTLSCSVTADDADNLTLLDFSGDIPERPKVHGLDLLRQLAAKPRQRRAHGSFDDVPHAVAAGLPMTNGVSLTEMVDTDGRIGGN